MFGCGDGITGICICPNSSSCPQCVRFFVHQLYLNKATFQKYVIRKKNKTKKPHICGAICAS